MVAVGQVQVPTQETNVIVARDAYLLIVKGEVAEVVTRVHYVAVSFVSLLLW